MILSIAFLCLASGIIQKKIMNEREIFNNLFEVAKKSKDPEGVVAACLVKDGIVILSVPSAEDGIRHAEDLLIGIAGEVGVNIDSDTLLVTTLEPCSYRNPSNKVEDCTTIIINSGIKRVLYAARDPDFSKDAKVRFSEAGVEYLQVEDKAIVKKAVELFNSTIKIPLTSEGLPRAKKFPG